MWVAVGVGPLNDPSVSFRLCAFGTLTYRWSMFGYFTKSLRARQITATALDSIAEHLHGSFTGAPQDEALADRVGVLEVKLAATLAEAEATLVKAGAKFNAARAAEERERRLSQPPQSPEVGDDGEPYDLEEAVEAMASGDLREEHAGVVPDEGLQPVSGYMAARSRGLAAAWAMKWGG